MHLSFAFFADAAEVREKLLFVLGGNFDTVSVAELPSVFRGALAIRIGLDGAPPPTGERRLKFVVRPPTGDDITLEAGVRVSGDLLDAPWDPGLLLAIKLDGMPLLVAGMYETSVVFDGEDLGGPKFRVVQTVKPNRKTRRRSKAR